jgi:hypothetical protein
MKNLDAQGFLMRFGTLECRLRKLKADYADAVSSDSAKNDENEDAKRQAQARDRFAAHQSLCAVLDFIESIPEWQKADLGFAVRRVIVALTNIEQGQKEEWLANPLSHRPPLPIEVRTARGRIAGIMEVLFRAGYARTDAAKIIQKHILPDTCRRLTGGTSHITWQRIAEWRDQVTGASTPGPELRGYKAQLALPIDWSEDLERTVQKVLRSIAGVLQ